MAEADVENLASALCRIYSSKKAQQLGKPYRPHSRFRADGLWFKAAQICLDESADPDSFIEAAFRYNTVPGGPFPQQLGTTAIVRWYRQFLSDTTNASAVPGDATTKPCSPIEQELEMTMRHTAILALRRGNPKKTLMDPTIWHIPDYARVVLMPKDADILQRFGRSAAAQLSESPALMRLLKEKGYDLSFLEAVIA